MSFHSALASDLPAEQPVPSRFIFPVLIIVGLSLTCGTASGQRSNEVLTYHTITDPKTGSSVVARVGPISITAREFLLSYEFGPAFPKRSKDSKKRYLEFMTYEKLLALEGYARGLERSPRAREALDEMEADLATEELFRDDVMKKIHVADAEVELGVRQQLLTLSLRWLYAPAHDEIARLGRLLASGVPFDSLYRSQRSDSGEARALETTRFKLRGSNPTIAMMVDTLHVGVPSAAAKGTDGWYIIMLDHTWISVLPTNSDVSRLRNDARRVLFQDRSDSLSNIYVNVMMLKRKPVIIRTTFNAIGEHIGRTALTPEQYREWDLSRFRTDEAQHLEDTLVTFASGQPFFPEDFYRWFRGRATSVKFSRRSANAYYASLEEVVWRMVRDRLLTARAKSRGCPSRETVRTQKQWWEHKILYELVRSAIAESIAVSDSTVEKYYRENRRRYVSAAGDTMTLANVKDEIRKSLFEEEFNKRLLHTILALKREHTVTVDEKLLKGLPVDVENDPRAIDVYTVKKGGILPRQAFPAIDYAWQAWQ